METIIYPHCDEKIPKDTKVCEYCCEEIRDNNIDSNTSFDENESKFCAYCGKKLNISAEKCEYCGKSVISHNDEEKQEATNNFTFSEYLNKIKPLLSEHKKIDLNEQFQNVDFFYENVRKAKFMGNKLNIFTFVHYVPKINRELLENYFDLCAEKSDKNFFKTFLFGGIGTGYDLCISLLVSENIDDDMISACLKTKKGRKKVGFEGAIYDLTSQTLHRKKTKNIFGAVYNSFRDEFVEKFDI
ncbi:MAG: hypothetical protein FWH29_03340 [Methanobrevibacter sp.]|nr:hypothetical protein [Methanobrevibacter sp.]